MKNYVDMWWQEGLHSENKSMQISGSNYSIVIDTNTGKIKSLSSRCGLEEKQMNRVGMNYGLSFHGKKYEAERAVGLEAWIHDAENGDDEGRNPNTVFDGQGLTSRIIDSGRYMQRMDILKLHFKGAEQFIGRMQVAALQNSFVLHYGVYFNGKNSHTVGLSYEIIFPETFYRSDADEAVITNGNESYAFIPDSNDRGINIAIVKNTVIVSYENFAPIPYRYCGFSVGVVPYESGSIDCVERFKAVKDCKVFYNHVAPKKGSFQAVYDAETANYILNCDGGLRIRHDEFADKEKLNCYDRLLIEIANSSDHDLSVPLVIQRKCEFSVTGLSPILRDAETLEPVGVPVQISKNWHCGRYEQDPLTLLEGPWFHAYTELFVPARSARKIEYTCAYGEWGGLPAASHAQLCLVGWGGNQLWDQSALGSWGESVTYDPDVGLGRAFVDDVRPFMTLHGRTKAKYSWTGNIGGADFLVYVDKTGKRQQPVGMRTHYISQAPCMTDVQYSGRTPDGCIGVKYTVNMGRTDDIPRNYYRLEYEILKDTNFERLALFQVAADGYSDNKFTKYAIGVGGKTVDEGVHPVSGEADIAKNVVIEGQKLWMYLYDSQDIEENGNIFATVRECNMIVGGKRVDALAYSKIVTADQTRQIAIELNIPTKGSIVRAGSKIDMVIEYDILPQKPWEYYGSSDYLLGIKDKFYTVEAALQQQKDAEISCSVIRGVLRSVYPLSVDCADLSDVLAEVEISGGLDTFLFASIS